MRDADIAELELACGAVSRETIVRLETFAALFRHWSSRINLSAPSATGDLWRRHIIDSAQLVKIAPNAQRWADFGSGGGFPGIVLAILMQERGGSVEMVESNRKKAAFLQLAAAGLPARVHAGRIEDVASDMTLPDVVTARALAPLPRLLDLLAPPLLRGAKGVFHKGREYRSELSESAASWRFDLVEHRSMTDPDAALLEISNLCRIGGD